MPAPPVETHGASPAPLGTHRRAAGTSFRHALPASGAGEEVGGTTAMLRRGVDAAPPVAREEEAGGTFRRRHLVFEAVLDKYYVFILINRCAFLLV